MIGVLRIIAIFLMGMMVVTYSSPSDARRGKARVEQTKEQKEEVARTRAEAQQREKEKRTLKKFQENARDYAMYLNCDIQTEAIESEYLASPIARASDISSTDEYLFRAYLKTNKWDGECFEWKDPVAAKRVGKTLKEYVIEGMHRELRARLHKLFVALEVEECGSGIKCRPGITTAFRDNYRQKIATGFKARDCESMHGGTCRTKGWGDGRAVDVVNVSEPNFFEGPREQASEVMWHHIDRLGQKIGIYRPMQERDSMHLQPSVSIEQSIVSKMKENPKGFTTEVKKKKKRKRRKR